MFLQYWLSCQRGGGWDESKRVQRNLEKLCKNAGELATFSGNQLQNKYFPKKNSENFVFRMLACAKKWWMKMVLLETFLVSFKFQVYFYVRVLEFVCVCSGVVVCVTKCLCMCLYIKCNKWKSYKKQIEKGKLKKNEYSKAKCFGLLENVSVLKILRI